MERKGRFIKMKCMNCGTERTENEKTADGIRCRRCGGGPVVPTGFTVERITEQQREGRIEIEAEEYCYGCGEFEPECEKELYSAGYKQIHIKTTVKCKHLTRCRWIADRIKPPH